MTHVQPTPKFNILFRSVNWLMYMIQRKWASLDHFCPYSNNLGLLGLQPRKLISNSATFGPQAKINCQNWTNENIS